MAGPKRLVIVNGKRTLVEHDSRTEEYREYNQDRWKHQNDLMKFYNSKAWRQLSKLVLNESYYVCRICGEDATLSDHIIPVRVDWSLRLSKDNLQPLCESCHAIKTKKDKEMYGL
ncbi:HNH endonuclease [uncultured Vagococcus sp.]|uniref:HNH endonuclease n=1 Tax=uncultured Vagococcus sp. TaxID=189676 RepID=UPI00258BBFC7|nr:HNH endonuclease signature motif containing protein [uncultured Vagococcus sp.]